MARVNQSIVLQVRVAWWLKLHIALVLSFAAMSGQEPDLRKLQRLIRVGVRVRPVRKSVLAA